MPKRQWPALPDEPRTLEILVAAGLTEEDIRASATTPDVILQAAAETFARRVIRQTTTRKRRENQALKGETDGIVP